MTSKGIHWAITPADGSSTAQLQEARGIPAPGVGCQVESIYVDYNILFKDNKQFRAVVIKFILALCNFPRQYIRPQFNKKKVHCSKKEDEMP